MATGALHSFHKPILKMAETAAVAQTGSPYRLNGVGADEVATPSQSLRVLFRNEQSGGATSPTSQVKLQTSYNKVDWIDVASSTQLTADSTKS